MDPLAHTLVGASLSETRLKRLTPLATPTLVLAANAPDIDILSVALGGDFSLGFRRGWTHGILAMVVLPMALTGLILLAERGRARLRSTVSHARLAPILALAYIGTLTHPALDWLNTYGIRLLMPFDDRWFYGDALFIIDLWLWLLAGATVAGANSGSAVSRTAWVGLGLTLTALVTGVSQVPPVARWVWIAGVLAIVGARLRVGSGDWPRVAGICLAAAFFYAACMVAGSHVASRQVNAWLDARGSDGVVVMAGPLPANPFVRDIVVADDVHYHFLELNWLGKERIRIAAPAIERGPTGPIVQAALRAPQIQGVTTWMRFPTYAVETLSDGYRVTIRDARYTRLDGIGLGTAAVELDRDLRVREPSRAGPDP